MKYRVYFQTTASSVVEVEVPDGMDVEGAREYAIEQAYQEVPNELCAYCSGWGRKVGIELGGDWDVLDGEDGVSAVES